MSSRPTGIEWLKPSSKLIIGSNDLRDRAIGYADNLVRAFVATQFPAHGSFGATKTSLVEASNGGVYHLSISAPSEGLGTAGGWLMSYDTSASNKLGAIDDCPYPRGGGTTYYLGLRKLDIPISTRSSGGLLHLPIWKTTFGETGTPGTVTNNGDGTMRIELTATMRNRACGGVWGNHATLYRRCHVWLADPSRGTLGHCLYSDGQLKSNGSTVYVDIPHVFGQRTISTTSADYVIAIEGLTVSTTDLSAEVDSAGNLAYWLLGTVVDGAFDLSAQNLLSSPGTNALDLLQLATDLYDTPTLDGDGAANLPAPVQELIRMLRHDVDQGWLVGMQAPAIYIPGVAETYNWVTGYTIVDTGANRRVTFPALPANGIIFTGDSDGVIRACSSMPTGNYVDFAEAGAADTYVVYVEAEVFDASAGSESVKGRLKVATDAAFAALANTRLELLRFDWDGAATLSNEVPADLIRGRRPRPESENSLVVYDSTGGSVVTIAVGTVSSRPALRISPHANGVVADGDRAHVAFRLRRVGSNIESCWYGHAGEDDGAGSGDFTTDRHDQQFGGYSDWNWRYLTDMLYLGSPEYPTTGNFLKIDKDGGAQEDTNGAGDKPVVGVPDLKLIGSNGKIVEVSIPLSSGVATSTGINNWAYAASGGPPTLLFWDATGGSKTLMFEAPHRVGENLIGFKAIGWIGGGDPTDTMTATIQRLDSDSATGTLTQETLAAGDNTWDGLSDPTPTTKTVTLQTEVAGSATDRWFLQLFTTIGGVPDYHISHVVARYRRTEI